MLVVEVICNRHVLLVKPVVAGLVAADEQNGSSPGVEGIEDPKGVVAGVGEGPSQYVAVFVFSWWRI